MRILVVLFLIGSLFFSSNLWAAPVRKSTVCEIYLTLKQAHQINAETTARFIQNELPQIIALNHGNVSSKLASRTHEFFSHLADGDSGDTSTSLTGYTADLYKGSDEILAFIAEAKNIYQNLTRNEPKYSLVTAANYSILGLLGALGFAHPAIKMHYQLALTGHDYKQMAALALINVFALHGFADLARQHSFAFESNLAKLEQWLNTNPTQNPKNFGFESIDSTLNIQALALQTKFSQQRLHNNEYVRNTLPPLLRAILDSTTNKNAVYLDVATNRIYGLTLDHQPFLLILTKYSNLP